MAICGCPARPNRRVRPPYELLEQSLSRGLRIQYVWLMCNNKGCGLVVGPTVAWAIGLFVDSAVEIQAPTFSITRHVDYKHD